ncbi:hypothetical protein AAIR98_001382 [Elusimicrobium simillimum]|uniref:acyloxyacyl hydrolase n=1 Tax=Elusimicrobium simillimum TaxID=3143438 RepID=UPI003C704467
MKKFLLALLALMPLSPLCAVEYKKGDVQLSVSISTAYPFLGTWGGEYYVDNLTTGVRHDAKLGKWSVGSNLEAVYFLNSSIAVGLQTGHNEFADVIASGVEEEVGTNISNIMFLTRYYFNPAAKFKYYTAASIGIAFLKAYADLAKREEFEDTGFGAKLGFGTEYYFGKKWGTGAELRYNHNTFKVDKNISNGDRVRLYPRANYFSFSLRLFRKF